MIISASRRTDIPAFYAEWFMNRIRAGFVVVRNPFNDNQLRHVSVKAEDVEAIIFWTRNPENLLAHLDELDARGYRYSFHYTITGYPSALEGATPDQDRACRVFAELSERIGADRVFWRYDPILLCNLVDFDGHVQGFERIATRLHGKTRRVTISFAEIYRKTARNLGRIAGLTYSDITGDPELSRSLASELSRIALRHGMEIHSCATSIDLRDVGVRPGSCIDEQMIPSESGFSPSRPKDKGQRPNCNCVKSIDIGQYNTCLHDCLYCYATEDKRTAAINHARHDPHSPLLVGHPLPSQKVVMASGAMQLSLF
jgi:hypothetical protein